MMRLRWHPTLHVFRHLRLACRHHHRGGAKGAVKVRTRAEFTWQAGDGCRCRVTPPLLPVVPVLGMLLAILAANLPPGRCQQLRQLPPSSAPPACAGCACWRGTPADAGRRAGPGGLARDQRGPPAEGRSEAQGDGATGEGKGEGARGERRAWARQPSTACCRRRRFTQLAQVEEHGGEQKSPPPGCICTCPVSLPLSFSLSISISIFPLTWCSTGGVGSLFPPGAREGLMLPAKHAALQVEEVVESAVDAVHEVRAEHGHLCAPRSEHAQGACSLPADLSHSAGWQLRRKHKPGSTWLRLNAGPCPCQRPTCATLLPRCCCRTSWFISHAQVLPCRWATRRRRRRRSPNRPPRLRRALQSRQSTTRRARRGVRWRPRRHAGSELWRMVHTLGVQ